MRGLGAERAHGSRTSSRIVHDAPRGDARGVAYDRRDDMAGLLHRVIERDAPAISLTIDGEPVQARAGDLLITAVLLHRGELRRFEFAPASRAGFCWMGACQDCWVRLADGRRVRACTTTIEPGMHVVIDGGRHG